MMIIDSDSFEKVVFIEMVQKLNLETISIPHPYKLYGLQSGNEIKVNKRCLVFFFSIGNYEDRIWCDVAAMDASHILLGRSWLYDRKFLYNGFKHVYSFEKDGCKLALAPLEPSLISKPIKLVPKSRGYARYFLLFLRDYHVYVSCMSCNKIIEANFF